MAIEGSLAGLYVGADHQVVYTDASDPPADMSGWTIVLEVRKFDSHPTILLSKTGTVSGTYNADPSMNTQKCTFVLDAETDLSSTKFPGDDQQLRYSIKRTDDGFEQPLRYGDLPLV